ncbi:MAG TPA: hypothetical protein VMC42_00065 [Methanoregulaceae archaeon]|nr:hypothetical protein [Methanoregulaceae archaeon]
MLITPFLLHLMISSCHRYLVGQGVIEENSSLDRRGFHLALSLPKYDIHRTGFKQHKISSIVPDPVFIPTGVAEAAGASAIFRNLSNSQKLKKNKSLPAEIIDYSSAFSFRLR